MAKAKKVSEKEANNEVKKLRIEDYDRGMVAIAVKNSDNEFVRIADYDYKPQNDHVISCNIEEKEMTASVLIKQPGQGGTDVTYEEIISVLESNGVKKGILKNEVSDLADHPVYNKAIVVAKGEKAINGKNAKIKYNFDIEGNIELKEKHGKIDFKEMNKIQNVVTGQVLAKKITLEEGKHGYTVTGKLLPAKNGRT